MESADADSRDGYALLSAGNVWVGSFRERSCCEFDGVECDVETFSNDDCA